MNNSSSSDELRATAALLRQLAEDPNATGDDLPLGVVASSLARRVVRTDDGGPYRSASPSGAVLTANRRTDLEVDPVFFDYPDVAGLLDATVTGGRFRPAGASEEVEVELDADPDLTVMLASLVARYLDTVETTASSTQALYEALDDDDPELRAETGRYALQASVSSSWASRLAALLYIAAARASVSHPWPIARPRPDARRWGTHQDQVVTVLGELKVAAPADLVGELAGLFGPASLSTSQVTRVIDGERLHPLGEGWVATDPSAEIDLPAAFGNAIGFALHAHRLHPDLCTDAVLEGIRERIVASGVLPASVLRAVGWFEPAAACAALRAVLLIQGDTGTGEL